MNGHTIEVVTGTYLENLVINKSITLLGEDKNTTIIDGNHTGYVVIITADWVNITGFTITNSKYISYIAGIEFYNANNCSVKNNVLSDNRVGIHSSRTNGFQITNNDYQDRYPKINENGWVVWYGGLDRVDQIFLWDGISITQLTNTTYNNYHPNINSNNHVVWRGHTGGHEIFYWDGISTTQVTNTNRWSGDPQINNNNDVVWEGDDGSDWEIYYWNGISTTQLTNNVNITDADPQINNNGHVVWSGHDGNDSEIYYWDGNTITQLTNNSYVDSVPQINDNNHVVWYYHDGSDSEIYYWDGISTTQITNNALNDRDPEINNNNHVVWRGVDGIDYDIFYWNGTGTTQITDNDYFDADPRFNNNDEVTWRGDNDIYFWDGNDITQVTNDDYTNECPVINDNGWIVWDGFNFRSGEIFLWNGSAIIAQRNYNFISDNDINDNRWGIRLLATNDNLVYHNNFINNIYQAYDNGINSWDDGYPSGGNYWSDYSGLDVFSGVNQDNPGSDGIGDTNYSIFGGLCVDNYPLINPDGIKIKEIPLNVGWNLISLPLEQNDTSFNLVLDSINGKWDCIQYYDALDSTWKSYNTYRPDSLNNLDSLNHMMGFWINITEPNVTLTVKGDILTSTSIPLYAGWNLVGYPTMTEMIVADALWSTGADKAEVFDPAKPYRIKEVGPTYLMKPGEGYWVHVPADTTWVVDW